VNDPAFITEALASKHDRSSFTCGVEPLDRYLQQQATQDIRRRIASCFVMVEKATGAVAGYHTISATSLLLTDLPEAQAKRLPRHPLVPAVSSWGDWRSRQPIKAATSARPSSPMR
jgi:hypothetical protein